MTSSHASNVHPGDVSPPRSLVASSAVPEPKQPWFIRLNLRCKRFCTGKQRKSPAQIRHEARKVHVATMEEARRKDMDLEDQRKSGKSVQEWRKMKEGVKVDIEDGEGDGNGCGAAGGEGQET